MENKKIIVTGANGFIGSWLTEALCDQYSDVHGIDNLSADNEVWHYDNRATYHSKDIFSDEIADIFEGAECVFHLAAESRIGPCIENPQKAVNTNTVGTLRVLEACRKHKIKRIVYSSTSAVYGLTSVLPTSEYVSIDCLNPYSTSKYCGEEMVKLYTKMYEIDSCIFRYFNVYGDRSPTKGQYAPVVGLFLKQVLERKPLYVVGDGEQRRDFVHVSDVVNANILAGKREGYINAQIFNVGSGNNISINQLAHSLSRNVSYVEQRPGEARHTLADIRSIYKELGWEPKMQVGEWLKNKLT